MLPQELPPQGPAGLEGLPPEILQLLLAQGQQAPVM